jgi:competence protein ComEC
VAWAGWGGGDRGGPHDRRGAHRARLVAAGLAFVVLAGVGLTLARGGPPGGHGSSAGGLTVSFLDVGQGDATLLQLDGAAVLFDTGPPGGPILSRLAAAGVRRLDVLVLTHAQLDHEGVALAVIARYRPRLVLDGGAGWPTPVQRTLAAAAATAGARVQVPRAGQTLGLGRLRLRVLWPPAPQPGWRPDGDANQRAVVALASVGAFDLLLPSDAESDVTLPLDLPQVEALKVAHHGSSDEGLRLLLHRLAPAVAAIEVGRHNTYGHPAPAALTALRTVPHVYRTDRDGTIRLHVHGNAMSLDRTRKGAADGD